MANINVETNNALLTLLQELNRQPGVTLGLPQLDAILRHIDGGGEDDDSDSSSSSDTDLGPLASTLVCIKRSNHQLEFSLRRYVSDLLEHWSELLEHLEDARNRSDRPALASIQSAFSQSQRLIERLTKVLRESPDQCDILDKIVDRFHPPSFELFVEKYAPLIAELRAEIVTASETCLVCGINNINVRLQRCCQNACGSENEPQCRCNAQVCLDCLLQTYWTQTEHELRSSAPCPLCRSPFCLLDLQPLPPKTRKSPRIQASQSKRQKRVLE